MDADEAQNQRLTPLASYGANVIVACPVCARITLTPATDYFIRLDRYPQQADAIDRARAVALSDNPAGWLILTGNYGSGKSTILNALCRTLASRGLHARFYTAPALRQAMYDAMREETMGAWLASLKRTRVLAIDELDAVKWSDQNVEETMSELLNARYQATRATLTVLAGADLGAVPGRIKSRMSEFGISDLGKTDLRGADDTATAVWDRGE